MKLITNRLLLVIAGFLLVSQSQAQNFTKTKPKINVTVESYGLGIENFGVLNGEGKELLDTKDIKYGEQISLAFYNVTGFEVKKGLTHLRMNMTVVNQTDNVLLATAQTVLDEDIDPATIKDDYIYGYMTISKDFFLKGKTYLIKLHLWDVASGFGVDMIWKFKANFK